MRGKFLAVSLVVLVGGSSIGCKTTSNMAWWKNAGKDAPEAQVLAHSAPALPSEIAKQVEGIAAVTSEQLVGGQAAPFVPGAVAPPAVSVASVATPSAYPSTEAPTFTPSTPVAAVPTAPATSNLGSIAMPYNPNAVPPAATVTPTAPVSENRYAAATTSAPASEAVPSATAYPGTAPRYGEQVAATPVVAATTPTQPTTPGYAANLGGRYAQAATADVPMASVPVDNSLANQAPPVPEVVAETAPFRPGGTSTYPGASAIQNPVQVATRPEVDSLQTPATTTPIDVSLPASTIAPQVPRYR